MVQFSRLRLQGFKSFVDKTELEIGPGLNGVVGPNGCGKSNLVEALRWVMGESSAKRMRGSGMEDVIFNGTDQRSARNIAEVSLALDNDERSAPAQYNDSDELEIVRRIERDKGSNYRINGKPVRARDVHMFFADSVSGANSPALVSQGRVTEIIKAKPLERRLILEDSAGISGLFVRRHEAELKLRAADNNLLRIEDLLGSMESRLNSLKRQAKQAARYKNINAQIRQFDLAIAYLKFQKLSEDIKSLEQSFGEAESLVADHLKTVSQLTQTQTTRAQDLPNFRKAEAEIAARLQSKKLELQRLEDEAKRYAETLESLKSQLQSAQSDLVHEQQIQVDAQSLLEKLQLELNEIAQSESTMESDLTSLETSKLSLGETVAELDEKYTSLMRSEAEKSARLSSLMQQIEQNEGRAETLKERLQSLQENLAGFKDADTESSEAISAIEAEIENAQLKRDELSQALTDCQAEAEQADEELNTTQESFDELDKKLSAHDQEISLLQSYLDTTQDDQNYTKLIDQVQPQSGFEKALARALGDALMASMEEGSHIRWVGRSHVDELPALPDGATALLPYIDAPESLNAALSQVGYVLDDSVGDLLADDLKPGQALVSKDGAYWRWDGLCISADASDQNAIQLEHKNRLESLLEEKETLLVEHAQQLNTLETLQESSDSFAVKQKSLDADIQIAANLYSSKQIELAQIKEQFARQDSEIHHLKLNIESAKDDYATLQDVLSWDKKRLLALQEETGNEQSAQIGDLKANLDEAREAYNQAVSDYQVVQQEQSRVKARLQAIGDETVNANNRLIRAKDRIKTLSDRQSDLQEKIIALEARNQDDDSALKDTVLDAIQTLEAERNSAAEKLATCENEVFESGRALKEAENKLGDAREIRAHVTSNLENTQSLLNEHIAHVRESYSMAPESLEEHIALDLSDGVSTDALQQKRQSFVLERERIGAVNLRAEEEAAELDKEVGGMISERNDLLAAISELRNGIQTINVEARQRLTQAFDTVNAHFKDLFARLFDGGKAYLALDGSDDPLEAGLEIYAQPPGKSLQSLSLLSGGEQTMASIALIFAMFLTNPSPICVLDEIDAPLDDANVDRVCNLLEEIAKRGETRFLVITHHRLTMARMDRLYGVTMQERGVSQLVSVDLQQSFDFADAA